MVWQARQADGSWDIWAKNLSDSSQAFAVTTTLTANETRPMVDFPWVVYQSVPVSNPNAASQIYAKHLVSGDEQLVDASGLDQADPYIHQERVVWQDFRDVGPGEIYFKDLNASASQRITNNTGGQFNPVIENQWIVWADNRNQQIDLYAYNLLRSTEIQLTDTPEDETRPSMNKEWVVYEEDLAGEQNINLRLLYLPNLANVQLTNAGSDKEKPVIVSSNIIWTETTNNLSTILRAPLPDLQPVFNNRNMVAVTDGLLDYIQQAGDLLQLWQEEAGVLEITRYSQLVPNVVSETVSWNGSTVVGDDFTLAAGDFLWVKFDSAQILDFANSQCGVRNLVTGVNVLSGHCFPDNYTAHQLIEASGVENIRAVRALDAKNGRWQVAMVVDGHIIGEDFAIPNTCLLYTSPSPRDRG